MVCATCGHASTDHLSGRCVNQKMRHEPAVGAVIDRCVCKHYVAPQTPRQAVAAQKAVEPEAVLEAEEPATVEEVEESEDDEKPRTSRRR